MPTFPAFEDQEPPPRSVRERVIRVSVFVTVLALVAGGALGAEKLRDRGAPGRPDAASPAASGTATASRNGAPEGILWYDSERLAVADPDGGRRQRISGDFATTQPRFRLALSPDRKSAVTEDGFLVALDRTDLAPPQRVLPADLGNAVVPSTAYGDGGRTVAVDLGQPRKPLVGVLTLATGQVRLLGRGTAPAGDPRTTGAALAVGVRELATGPGLDGDDIFLDTDRIERVAPDNFAPPVVLLRKSALLELMGLPPATPAGFTELGFAPDGEHIYFTAVADAKDPGPYGPTGRWAVGVVSRAGEVAAFKVLDKLHHPGSPVWSPGGDQLAFVDFAGLSRLERARGSLQLWTLGPNGAGAPAVLPAPEGQQPFSHDACVWKPDGTRLLCGDDRAWYVFPTAGGSGSVAESVPGRPLAWVGP